MDNKDIDEIIFHIKKLRKINSDDSSQKGSSEDEEEIMKEISIKTKPTNEKKEAIKTADIIEDDVMDQIEEIEQVEPVSVMKPEVVGWTDASTVTCDLCEKEIILGKNLSGLVIADEFFACEHCCQALSKQELMEWTKSKMMSTADVRPIGLWVIEQQSENRSKDEML